MIYKLIMIDVVLAIVLLILVLILIRRTERNQYSREVRELERRLNEAAKEEEDSDDEDKTEEETGYVGSSNSKKYHLTSCRFVKLMKDKEVDTLEGFKKRKYSPCDMCLKK
jgi:flagellar biosynthesis/type III secretory pathway M-ring protein FliF/YscJ